mmetsp:Transcript_35250/g.82220  ORF Transcript_35250/g.82220 Transcript_35250/m.82220 type:complete len:714 (-) Transcript_35250:177-2318(-)
MASRAAALVLHGILQTLHALDAPLNQCEQHSRISECLAFRHQHLCVWDVAAEHCVPEMPCDQRPWNVCHTELTTGGVVASWDDTRNKCFWDGGRHQCRWADECFLPDPTACAAAGCIWSRQCTPADMSLQPGPGFCFESCKAPRFDPRPLPQSDGQPERATRAPQPVRNTTYTHTETSRTGIVQTTSGPVQGLMGSGVQTFLGIPFAQAPVGALRWAAPQKMPPWSQVFQATAFGPACTQSFDYYAANPENCKGYTRGKCYGYTEDCLSLNVWTPSTSGSRAVMVWIHGGCYVSGSASDPQYNGSALAVQEDVVVVSIQYRLGVFGFLGDAILRSRDPKGSTGNYGLLDTVAALKWVQENIAFFGGDKERVTIFGESSGAGSVSLLLGMQEAWPFYHRGIMESGTGSAWTYITLSGAHANFKQVVSTSKCSKSSSLLSCIVSASQTVVAEAVNAVPCKDGCTWAPVVDGVLVRGTPLQLAQSGLLRPDTPMIAGFNLNDGAMFVPGYPFAMATMSQASMQSYYSNLYGEERVQTLEKIFQPETTSKASWMSKFFHAAQACETDFSYTCTAQWIASSSALHGSPAFVYKFSETGSFGLVLHGDEIPFVFGTLDSPSGTALKVSQWMMKYWANFAKFGNPNGEYDQLEQDEGLPPWPAWSSRDPVATLLNVSSTPQVVSFPNNSWPGCSFFLEHWDFYSLCLPQTSAKPAKSIVV